MPHSFYRLIRGSFQIAGFKPDGDSIRFAASVEPFRDLYGAYKADFTKGSFQLRLEGIDAPETHYGSDVQPMGDEARDHLVHLLGTGEVEFSGQRVVKGRNDQIPGAILTRSFDSHGRPISYALVGEDVPSTGDGDAVRVDEALLAKTLNARMVAAGFAYPLLYTSTPAPHRAVLCQLAEAARRRAFGIWQHDCSREFRLQGRESIAGRHQPERPPEEHPSLIYPKFFRRCIDYFRQTATGAASGRDFPDWLAASERENDTVVVKGMELRLSALFEQKNSRVRCQADVFDMVFVEK
ncbi:MAG: thermonuclease family protein [Myxococcales bacterium]|nr:thermonuclease family protein [Myxococcales bacterium]